MIDLKKARENRNKDLIDRMKKGEGSLNLYAASDTWFPRREPIKKDPKALDMLFEKPGVKK